jgi:peptidoglycan/LPS O-acetylase OafA/YrhL
VTVLGRLTLRGRPLPLSGMQLSSVESGKHLDGAVWLDLVRVAAALLVMLGHLRTLLFVDYNESSHGFLFKGFYALTGLGHASVLVFFVLSGYWVGGSSHRRHRRQDLSIPRYAVDRLTRLWIVLIPALILTLGLDYIRPSEEAEGLAHYHNILPASPPHEIVTLIGNLAFLQGVRLPAFGSDTPLWSLSYEVAYYAMFPALLIIVGGRHLMRSRIAALVVLLAIAILYGPVVLSLFPVWLAGALLAAGLDRMHRSTARQRAWLPWTALIGLLALMVVSSLTIVGERLGTTMLTLATCAAIGILVRYGNTRGMWSWCRSATVRGAQSSYSIYVVHLPILAAIMRVMGPKAEARWHLSLVSFILFSAVAAATLGIAVLFASLTEWRTNGVRQAILRGRIRAAGQR